MSESAGDNSKPRVVVLGGCGFIGRNLVEYLITNELVSGLRVVDKTPPQLAFLNPSHSKCFEDPLVEYKSANLINPTSCATALEPNGAPWDVVVNCAGETRGGQTEAVYAEGIVTLSTNVAKQCAKLNVRLVEISSGHMCSSSKPQKEDCPIEPWTVEGRMKSRVEQELKNMQPELNYTILRPAIVYGVGDRRSLKQSLFVQRLVKAPTLLENVKYSPSMNTYFFIMNALDSLLCSSSICLILLLNLLGLRTKDIYAKARKSTKSGFKAPRLLYGGIYKHLGETMKLLWTADLKMNTVHVKDVCRAIWTLGLKPEANGQIYNVVDEANSTQGSLAELVAEIFKINHDYYGTTISTLAKNDIAAVAEEANDKHLTAWAEICRKYALEHTPLEPSAGAELLLNKQLCLDGGKLGAALQLDAPKPTVDRLLEVLQDYASMNLFPKELLL